MKNKKKGKIFLSEIKELGYLFLRYNFFAYLLSNFRLFFLYYFIFFTAVCRANKNLNFFIFFLRMLVNIYKINFNFASKSLTNAKDQN